MTDIIVISPQTFLEQKKSEAKKDQFLCKDYAGEDSTIKERLGCK